MPWFHKITPESRMPERIEQDSAPDLKWLQLQVGGFIEVVNSSAMSAAGRCMVVNEEGRLLQLPYNYCASALAGQPIVGTAVLLPICWATCDEEKPVCASCARYGPLPGETMSMSSSEEKPLTGDGAAREEVSRE